MGARARAAAVLVRPGARHGLTPTLAPSLTLALALILILALALILALTLTLTLPKPGAHLARLAGENGLEAYGALLESDLAPNPSANPNPTPSPNPQP